MEEEKKLEKRKNIEIVVLSIIIVVLLGALIYLLFIKKDDKPVDNSGISNQQQQNNSSNENLNNLKITKIELTDDKSEQEVMLNNKKINLKMVKENQDYVLYINNVKLNGNVSWEEIYSTGNVLLLGTTDICGTIINNAINETGTLIRVVKEYSESNGDNGGEYYLDGNTIKVENRRIVAEIGHVSDCRCEAPDDSCEKNYRGKEKVEFIYDGEKVIIKKVAS